MLYADSLRVTFGNAVDDICDSLVDANDLVGDGDGDDLAVGLSFRMVTFFQAEKGGVSEMSRIA